MLEKDIMIILQITNANKHSVYEFGDSVIVWK